MGPDDCVAKKRKVFKIRKHQFKIITEGVMVGKRKANQMREMFAKMAKESEEEKSRGDKYEERRKEYFKLNLQHLSKKNSPKL